MTAEEELIQLRQENRLLREQASVHQETMSLQQELIKRQQEQITLLERELSLQQQQMTRLTEQVKALPERLSKDSHNSHLPPSSDRFVRKSKSLRKKSETQSGGQAGHPGASLQFSPTPDEVIEQRVERCAICHHDLQAMPACGVERRQVVDIPPARLIVREYRAEQKQCPQCQQITVASFPNGVQAPIQ